MSLLSLYEVPAPAKLNLFLHVVGRRADGYHLIESVFALIDWADMLHFERRADGALARHDLGPALPADDLCLRAARALKAASGSAWGADIHIHKHVPWGAGLGGGSSDAASTLLALNRLWGLHWPRARLLQIGTALGADVPFFVGGHNAFVQGIGERLSPLVLPVRALHLVKPPTAIATEDIFRSPLLVRNTPRLVTDFHAEAPVAAGASSILPGCLQHAEDVWRWAAAEGRNDLQAAAEAHAPEVVQGLRWLHGRWGNSRMTGSGSAVFAQADAGSPQENGESPGAGLPVALPPGWMQRMCGSLPRHPLAAWAD